MSHPNGYTKEDIKKLLGSAWLDYDNMPESGNEMRKRKGREMRASGEKKVYPTKRVGPNFDEDGKYIYPEGSGFNYMDYVNSHGGDAENNKVS
jgi:hypothetical protein